MHALLKLQGILLGETQVELHTFKWMKMAYKLYHNKAIFRGVLKENILFTHNIVSGNCLRSVSQAVCA